MALRPKAALGVAAIVTLLGAAAYLRDPPWLVRVTSGLGGWETDEAGHRYRWTRGRASFFVPADAAAVVLTMRDLKDIPANWPVTATITIDDRPGQVVRLRDGSWQEVILRLPPRANRAVRRIDVHLDRVRSRQRGIQLRDVRTMN